jgi:hypothetical protein
MNSAWVALPHPSDGIRQPVAQTNKTLMIKSDDTGPQRQMSVAASVRWRRLEIANVTAVIAARALKNVQDSVA